MQGVPLTVVGFDTETHLVRQGDQIPRLVCLSMDLGDGPKLVGAAEAVALFADLLASDATCVAHNAAFDLAVLVNAGQERGRDMLGATFRALEAGRLRCTMVREKLLAIAQNRRTWDRVDGSVKPAKFSLDTLVLRYLGLDISESKKGDTWRTRYAELENTHVDAWPEAARTYALRDATYARDVFLAQGTAPMSVGGHVVVDDHGDVTDELPQVRAAFALYLLSAWGVRTEKSAVDAWAAELETEAAACEAVGRAGGWVRPDGTVDTKALQARVLAANPDAPRTPTGKVSTAGEVLDECGDPDLKRYAAGGFARKQLTTYLPSALAGLVAPITGGFDTLLETGRTSQFQPNLQNPPRGGGYRACFVPRPGYVLCSVDYDTAELRALAQVHTWFFGRSTLGDAIRAGKDVHVDLAADMLGITYQEAYERRKAKDPTAVMFRQMAKVGNFGFWGGMGARAFVAYAHGQGVEIHETMAVDGKPSATALREAFMAKWAPESYSYFDMCAGMTRYGDAVALQAVSNRVRAGVGFSQLANGFFQGLVADFAKAAVYALQVACYTGRDVLRDDPPPGGESPLLGCRPVLFLHDEVIAEVPIHRQDACAREMARVMTAVGQLYCPDVPITAAPALMERWYKGAEAAYGPTGLLIPWRP